MISSVRRGLAFLASAFVLTGSLAFGSSASAAADVERHCVAHAYPVGEVPAEPALPTCFTTFAEAIAFATKGAVVLDPATKSRPLAQEELASQFVTVISIDYEHQDFGGSTLSWETDISDGCYSTNFSAGYMPSGWDNVISSSKSYQYCNYNYHYENQNFGGARLSCGIACTGLGAMNDQTSSRKWQRYP